MNSGISICALTSSQNDPSSRFRMRQYVGPLRQHDIVVEERCPLVGKYVKAWVQLTGLPALSRLPGLAASHTADISWINRELIYGLAGLERMAGGVRIVDIDDALWVKHGDRFARRLARACHGIIAANDYLSAYFKQYNDCVWHVPTCLDTSYWRPPSGPRPTRPWTLGWSGTHWNLPCLYDLADVLADFLRATNDTRLLVVCDRAPRLPQIPAGRLIYTPWSEQEEVSVLHEMDLGLMPLPENAWTRGKSAFKMLAYMAAGLPVIASPVGVAGDILRQHTVGYMASTTEDWRAQLLKAWDERDQAALLGTAGRTLVEAMYSIETGAQQLANIFRTVLNR